MRKQIRKQLRLQFETLLHNEGIANHASKGSWPDWFWVYELPRPNTVVHGFLAMVIDQKRDSFTLEYAWSLEPEFPMHSNMMNPRDWPDLGIHRDAPVDGKFRSRVAFCWQRNDHWWQLADEPTPEEFLRAAAEGRLLDLETPLEVAIDRIPACVVDAIEKVKRYVLPEVDAATTVNATRGLGDGR